LYLPSAQQEVRAVILFCVKWHLLLTCDKISCQAYLKLFTYLIILSQEPIILCGTDTCK
jgi:hypothetical protein